MTRRVVAAACLLASLAVAACSPGEVGMGAPQPYDSLDAIAAALADSVGCERRRDGVGGAYSTRGLTCATTGGQNVVALLDMGSDDADRFVADRRAEPLSSLGPPRYVTVVRGADWLINASSPELAERVRAALGGEVVVVVGPEQYAAAAADRERADAEDQAGLPDRESYPSPPEDQSQSLIILIGPPSAGDDLGAMDYDEAFIEAIESLGLGVADGSERGPDGNRFFYYGPDAEAMLAAVRPVLARLTIPPGSSARLGDESGLLREEALEPSAP